MKTNFEFLQEANAEVGDYVVVYDKNEKKYLPGFITDKTPDRFDLIFLNRNYTYGFFCRSFHQQTEGYIIITQVWHVKHGQQFPSFDNEFCTRTGANVWLVTYETKLKRSIEPEKPKTVEEIIDSSDLGCKKETVKELFKAFREELKK